MRHGAKPTGLHRQAGLGPVKRLNLRLFVDREHDRVLGRIDVQPDDVRALGGKVGIARALEGADAVRLQVVGLPDTLHRTQGDAHVSGHRPAGPVGGFAGRLGAGQGHHLAHRGIAQRRLARLARGIAQEALDPGLGVAPLPAPYRRPADPGAPGRRGDTQPLGRAQEDPSPRHVLLGAVAIGHDRLQTSTILGRHQGTDDLRHGPSMPHLSALMNPMNASVH
jgi:hypothetical protein